MKIGIFDLNEQNQGKTAQPTNFSEIDKIWYN